MSNFTSPFVDSEDGYTASAYIEGVFNLYPPVRVRFRPIAVTDKAVGLKNVRKTVADRKDERADEVLAGEMAKRLVSWEFLDESGNAVEGIPEPSKEALLRCKTSLFQRLANVLFYGDDGGDPDPATGEAPVAPSKQLESDQKN